MKPWRGKACHYCGAPAQGSDHIVPRALLKRVGAVDMPHNLVPACEPCNVAKAHSLPTCQCDICRAALESFREIGAEIILLVQRRARVAKELTFKIGDVIGAELLGAELDNGTAEP